MTILTASAADEPDEPGEVALSKELPLDRLEQDLKRPMPVVRGINTDCVAAAAAGDAPNPEAYLEDLHGTQYDKDVSGHLPAARRGLQILIDYGRRASARLKALGGDLKHMDRHEKVSSDARDWTGFERFRAVFLGLLSFTLLGASIQQLAQLLELGGYTETLLEGLRFAFVPLVAVAALEIVGQKLLVGEKPQRNYARLLAVVCIGAAMIWSYGFTLQYSAGMGEGSEVNLDAFLGDLSADLTPSGDTGGEGSGASTLLASVVAEIFGAALIWLILFREFDEHAPWRLCVSRTYKDASREFAALSLAQADAARLEGQYQGRVGHFETGRRDLINEAMTAFHGALGDRQRTNDMTRRLRNDAPPPPPPLPPHSRFDRNRFPNNSSTNGEPHED